MMRTLLATALALCEALAACSPPPTQEPPSMLALTQQGGANAFLSQIAEAPFQTAYYARRRVWQTFEGTNGSETLEYTERVWSDGMGRFSVTPEDLVQPALAPQSEQVFLLMQKAREGFIYRLRDFRIRDLGSFLSAYRVKDLEEQVNVAGKACERLRIRAASTGRGYWEIDVDPTNGLILATHEFLADGTLVSSVETLEFQAEPDLSGVELHKDLLAVPFTESTAHQVLGFTPLGPNFLPRGFSLVKSEKISQGTDTWARYAYSDGAESLFLLYREEPNQIAPGADLAGPYTMKIFRAGRWTVAQASFGEHQIIAIGREPASILQQIVESCVP